MATPFKYTEGLNDGTLPKPNLQMLMDLHTLARQRSLLVTEGLYLADQPVFLPVFFDVPAPYKIESLLYSSTIRSDLPHKLLTIQEGDALIVCFGGRNEVYCMPVLCWHQHLSGTRHARISLP
jgi:hypothetical protein